MCKEADGGQATMGGGRKKEGGRGGGGGGGGGAQGGGLEMMGEAFAGTLPHTARHGARMWGDDTSR